MAVYSGADAKISYRIFGIAIFSGSFLSVIIALAFGKTAEKLFILANIVAVSLMVCIYPRYVQYMNVLFLFCMVTGITIMLARKPQLHFLAVILILALTLVNLFKVGFDISEQKTEWKALKIHSEEVQDKRIVFDEGAYRYLYNFSPPAGAVAWLCVRRDKELGASKADQEKSDAWLVSGDKVHRARHPVLRTLPASP